MDTQKLIVVLLMLAIIFSAITLVVTLSSDVRVVDNEFSGTDTQVASVVLNIVPNPDSSGGA